MNWLDIVLALILCLSVIGGLIGGFARVGIGFAAAVLGVLCGLWFHGSAGSFFLPYVSHKGIANFLGFVLIFLTFLVLGAIAGKLLALLLKWTGLSWLDRLLGAAFGFVRALVAAIAILMAIMAFAPNRPPRAVVESRLAPYFVDTAEFCASLAPREVREAVEDSCERTREAWSKTTGKDHRRLEESTF